MQNLISFDAKVLRNIQLGNVFYLGIVWACMFLIPERRLWIPLILICISFYLAEWRSRIAVTTCSCQSKIPAHFFFNAIEMSHSTSFCYSHVKKKLNVCALMTTSFQIVILFFWIKSFINNRIYTKYSKHFDLE